jgi:hypothetical protein
MKKINFLSSVLLVSLLSIHSLSAQEDQIQIEVPQPPQPEPEVQHIEPAPTAQPEPVPAPVQPPVEEAAPVVQKTVTKIEKKTPIKVEDPAVSETKPTFTFTFGDKRVVIDIYPIAGFPKPWSEVEGLLPRQLLFFSRDKSQRKMENQLISMALRKTKELYADQQGYFNQKIDQSLGENKNNEEMRNELLSKVAVHDRSVPAYILESYDRLKAYEILIHSIQVRTRQP